MLMLASLQLVSLRFVVQVSAEKRKKVVHFRLEELLLGGIFNRVGEVVEGISHLARSYRCRGILEGHVRLCLSMMLSGELGVRIRSP